MGEGPSSVLPGGAAPTLRVPPTRRGHLTAHLSHWMRVSLRAGQHSISGETGLLAQRGFMRPDWPRLRLCNSLAGRTLGNQNTGSFPFLTVQHAGILPDLVPLQLAFWFLLKSTTGGPVRLSQGWRAGST